MTNPLPIASIIFEGDFRLGILQALSIDRLYDLDTLSEYVIILNGADNETLRKRLDQELLRTTSKKFRDKITYLKWKDLLGEVPQVGYYDQQALKLAVSNHFDTEFYILLDGKNHFVAPASIETFFFDGKPIAPMTRTNDYWRGYLHRSAEAVDADTDQDWEMMMPSVTPAVMITDEANSLVQHLEKKYGQPLPTAMKEAGGTEFLMYYAHLRKGGAIDRYNHQEMPSRTLFTSWPQDPAIASRYIQDLGDSRPIFGLHRKRLPQLTAPQKEQVAAVWRLHLLAPWEDAGWFMEVE